MLSEYFIKPIVKTLMLKGQEGQSIISISIKEPASQSASVAESSSGSSSK